MSSATGSSAIARIANYKMTDVLDMPNNSDIIDNALISNDGITDPADPADMDTTLKTIFGMIIISVLTGNTILAAFCAILFIIAHRMITPEATPTIDAAIPTVRITSSEAIITPETATDFQEVNTHADFDTTKIVDFHSDSHNDTKTSVIITLPEEEVHVYRHARPTFDIIEVLTPASVSEIDTITILDDNSCFGTLASDIFNLKYFEKYLAQDKMYLVHLPTPNAAITCTGSKAISTNKTTKIVRAVRPAPKIFEVWPFNAKFPAVIEEEVQAVRPGTKNVKTTVFKPKLAVVVEEDEIEEEEIQAARPETNIVNIAFWNPKLSTIIEEDEHEPQEEEDDIELPRSSNDEHEQESSFNSCANLEDFSDDEEIIAHANKVNRVCEELDKVERFSDPVEHTIVLAKNIEAIFRKRDEEDLETLDSEKDTVAIIKQIEADTHPNPPVSPVCAASPTHTPEGAPRFTESGFLVESMNNFPAEQLTNVPTTRFSGPGFLVETPDNSPVEQTPEAPATRFSESGFLIENPENSLASCTPTPISRIAQVSKISKAAPKTPTGPRAPKSIFGPTAQKPIFSSSTEKPIFSSPTDKPIFTSPVGSPFNHTRKVSNETNTSEDTNETNETKNTDTAPDSPTSVYSTPDNVYEYQAMTGFTVCLSAKKGTGIIFDPIAQSGENIDYDREPLKETTPSPTSSCYQDLINDKSTASKDLETPYHYSEDSPEDLRILAILERPNGPKYAKLSCGNWYFYNDDGSVNHLNWEEYEELIQFIVGDVASLPQKLHYFAIQAATKHNQVEEEQEKEPIATVD